jgi:hypothetical protein
MKDRSSSLHPKQYCSIDHKETHVQRIEHGLREPSDCVMESRPLLDSQGNHDAALDLTNQLTVFKAFRSTSYPPLLGM